MTTTQQSYNAFMSGLDVQAARDPLMAINDAAMARASLADEIARAAVRCAKAQHAIVVTHRGALDWIKDDLARWYAMITYAKTWLDARRP